MQRDDADQPNYKKLVGDTSAIDLKKQMQAPLIVLSDSATEHGNEIVDLVIGNVDKFGGNLESAAKMTKEALDKHYGMTWQVIIGRGYSFDITALQHNLMHFYYQGELGILVYKT